LTDEKIFLGKEDQVLSMKQDELFLIDETIENKMNYFSFEG
jgi:hypothetical protein